VGAALGALSLSLLPMCTSLLGVGLVATAQGIFLAFLPPAANTLVGTSMAPEEQSFAIMGFNSSNFVAQTTMSPLMGLLLTYFGYSVVYPVIGLIWILLALVVLRAAIRLTRGRTATAQTAGVG